VSQLEDMQKRGDPLACLEFFIASEDSIEPTVIARVFTRASLLLASITRKQNIMDRSDAQRPPPRNRRANVPWRLFRLVFWPLLFSAACCALIAWPTFVDHSHQTLKKKKRRKI
jgi:hypothetical protein